MAAVRHGKDGHMKKKIRVGDEVRFNRGFYFAEGTVIEIYGHPSRQIALIRHIIRGPGNEPVGEETLNYRLERLELLPRKLDIQVAIHEDEETGGYWASVVQLPGCYATGRTRGELIEALSEAILLYLEEAEPAEMVEKVELKHFRFNKKSGLVPA